MKNIILTIAAAATALTTAAAGFTDVRFNDEKTDTTFINTLLTEAKGALPHSTPGERVVYFGRKLLDTPYKGGTLEFYPEEEKLTINMEEMDCTTFVETTLALAYTLGEGRTSWRDFAYNLERLRYKGGSAKGYASRLHYISDWIVDNAHRGNVREVTSEVDDARPTVKTLDFMSRNRESYPALADSLTYARLLDSERGYRSHRYYLVKGNKLGGKSLPEPLKEGDVVFMATKKPGLDVQHAGILVVDDGVPYLLHASSAAGKVVVDKLPIAEYMRKQPSIQGARFVRLLE